jgi:hypothetical protein
MQSLFAAARRKSLQTKSIHLVRLACWFDAAAVTVPFPRRAGPLRSIGADYGNTVARPNTAIAPRDQSPFGYQNGKFHGFPYR